MRRKIDKEEMLEILLNMDAEICATLHTDGSELYADLPSEEDIVKAIDTLREYIKIIVHLLGMQKEFAGCLGADVRTIEEATRRAYERWKEKKR